MWVSRPSLSSHFHIHFESHVCSACGLADLHAGATEVQHGASHSRPMLVLSLPLPPLPLALSLLRLHHHLAMAPPDHRGTCVHACPIGRQAAASVRACRAPTGREGKRYFAGLRLTTVAASLPPSCLDLMTKLCSPRRSRMGRSSPSQQNAHYMW